MQAIVRKDCISCGLCVSTCPEVFQMGEDGFAHGGEISEAHVASAREARDQCPVQAIDLKED